MPLVTYHPDSPLNDFVECLYYLYGQMPYQREKIMPAAWLDLKINLGGTIPAYGVEGAEPFTVCADSWAVGIWNGYHVVDWPPDTRLFGVRFRPGAAYPFLQIPISELHNQVVSMESIWGQFASEIRDRLSEAPTVQAGFAVLERLLMARLRDTPHGLNVVQYALTQLADHPGALSIRALSDQIGISQNHLNTHFKLLVGGTPKEMARLNRFQYVVDLVDPTQPVDWTRVAHQSLYYDQSHFNKDFVAFTGHNPSDYLRLRRQVHAENPEHARFLRELPTD